MIDDPLISSAELATSLRDARAFRILHRSQDMLGNATQSSGLVIVPTGATPVFPVMTWCHGTTGLGDASCPSAQPDPARELITYFTVEATEQIDYGIPGAQAFLDAGWAICATDYQGLGTPGGKLERDGLVHRATHTGRSPNTSYELTPLGISFIDPVMAVANWAIGAHPQIERNRELFAH